jgi:protein-S-isoprenylcysteine O-methyltransferase Ste14
MVSSFQQRGGWWVVGQSLLGLVILLLGVAFPGSSRQPPLLACGWLLLSISAFCGLSGAIALGRGLTPFPRPSPETRLVQRGIYRLMRHPLYTAVINAAFGWSMLRLSWTATAVSVALALLLNAKALREERWLREQFPEYADYQRRVKRFIPWVF